MISSDEGIRGYGFGKREICTFLRSVCEVSVAINMGYRRYCHKCKVPFYDKFSDPVVCPSCTHSVPAARFTQLKSSRLSSGFFDEDKIDDLEGEDIAAVDLDEEEGDIAGVEGEADILLIPSGSEGGDADDDVVVTPDDMVGEPEGIEDDLGEGEGN